MAQDPGNARSIVRRVGVDVEGIGKAHKEVEERLFISERTVESHVRGILNKLGFNSRAQIAGWMASSQ